MLCPLRQILPVKKPRSDIKMLNISIILRCFWGGSAADNESGSKFYINRLTYKSEYAILHASQQVMLRITFVERFVSRAKGFLPYGTVKSSMKMRNP